MVSHCRNQVIRQCKLTNSLKLLQLLKRKPDCHNNVINPSVDSSSLRFHVISLRINN